MENAEQINDMLDKILGGDNLGAQDDFSSLIAQKMTQALDQKKVEIASSLYQGQQVENGTEQEQEDTADDAADSAV